MTSVPAACPTYSTSPRESAFQYIQQPPPLYYGSRDSVVTLRCKIPRHQRTPQVHLRILETLHSSLSPVPCHWQQESLLSLLSLATDCKAPKEIRTRERILNLFRIVLSELGASSIMGISENITENRKDSLPGEVKKTLQSLASEWGDVVDSGALQVIPLKGAMTNEVFQIKWPTGIDDISRKVLVRIYGEGVELFFDRNNEIRTFEFMSKHGQGPRLLGRFPNGRIEEFIHARTLSAADLREPDISALIAAKMKEFHILDLPGTKKIWLWDRLQNWLNTAKRLSSVEEAKVFCLDAIETEISLLEKELSRDHQHIGFCHNDLQYGNIMIDEETKSITIIDYEYASYNPVAYDIANHFCEMAADYHTEKPHILDYNKYPCLEERQRFIQTYLNSSDGQPSDIEVQQLLENVEKYTLASHLLWGLWGIISEHVNKIDFDYMEYARQRFQEYWQRKPELLGSSSPSALTNGGITK